MDKIYFTSDLHIGHDRSFLYKPRGFEDSLSHDIKLVENWNNLIDDNDTVYILGDLMLNDNNWGMVVLNKLKGNKHIIIGNHDSEDRIKLYESAGIDCKYADMVKYGKYKFYLSHYPTFTGNKDKKISQTLINLYGHTHQQTKFYNGNWFMYNVGLDSHDMKPVEIKDIIGDIKGKYLSENNSYIL